LHNADSAVLSIRMDGMVFPQLVCVVNALVSCENLL
jgi:hypothetical protein